MLIAGVDEAGRGCVIGPLVVAGVAIKNEELFLLKELDVKDSKLLSSKKREELYPKILKIAHNHVVIKILPYTIDKAVLCNRKNYKLNRLEAQTMAKIIQQLKPDEAYVDAADVLEERFGDQIQECLTSKVTIISKHKADKNYPIVSAASIIAKVERDQEIRNLKKEHGDFGSGYSSDEKTLNFLKQLLSEYDDYPSFVRKSWKTARRTKAEKRITQKKLF